MLVTRYLYPFLASLAVTVALLFAMQALIKMSDSELDKGERFKLPDFVRVKTDEDVNRITAKPKKPPKPEEQPEAPEPEPLQNNLDLNAIEIGRIDPAVSINMQNGVGLAPGDGEYLPIVKVAPVYPRSAQRRCLEGNVVVEFTVTKNGSVRDPAVVSSTSKVFESSAKKAALKFKYKPRTVDGQPVETPNVQNKIIYRMDGC